MSGMKIIDNIPLWVYTGIPIYVIIMTIEKHPKGNQMKLIDLIIKATKKRLKYIATDANGKVYGYPTEPQPDDMWSQWDIYGVASTYLGHNDSISTNSNWKKSLINITTLKLNVLEKFNA